MCLYEIGNPHAAAQAVRDRFVSDIKAILQVRVPSAESVEVAFVPDTMLLEILILPPFKDSVDEITKRLTSHATKRDIAVRLFNSEIPNVHMTFECIKKEPIVKACPLWGFNIYPLIEV